jgi:hypothetical protein
MGVFQSPAKLPASKRSSYQFPVYRWIGWLTVAGYAAGLTAMFFIAGMFGIPAPLGWAFLVVMFVVGAMLLDRPTLLLGTMMFYFLLMPSNRLLGCWRCRCRRSSTSCFSCRSSR